MDRRALWKVLRSRGVPAILLDLISALHDGTAVRVRVGEELSGHLLTTSGVRQGCVLAPSLFCIAIDWILRHMTSRPRITVDQQHFTDLVYADDTTFLVDSPIQASSCLSSFSEAAAVFGLRISWPKTKIQNVGSGPQPPSILVHGNPVDSVSTITYLGSLQSSDGYCRPDVCRRITLASSVMSFLYCIWMERRLPLPIKIRVYLALVQSVLFYASETWNLTSADARSLEAFHMKCQRRILKISWRQFVRNSEISALTGLPAINDVIRHRRIAVFGHIARLQDSTPALC